MTSIRRLKFDIDLSKLNVKHVGLYYIYIVILQTLLSKVTYNWGIHKAINLEEASKLRKCP